MINFCKADQLICIFILQIPSKSKKANEPQISIPLHNILIKIPTYLSCSYWA